MSKNVNLEKILDGYKVGELKELAKVSGVKGYSKLKKAELVEVVSKQLEEVDVATLDVPEEIKSAFVVEEKKEETPQKAAPTSTPIIGVAPHVMNVAQNGATSAPAPAMPFIPNGKKIYPNEPCPCGSGKKYKKCCGKRA